MPRSIFGLPLLLVLHGCGDSADPAAPNDAGDPNVPPVAQIAVDPAGGPAPLTVTFDATGSSDPDGEIVGYTWDLGDGTEATGSVVTHTYQSPGHFRPTLEVRDDEGARGWAVGSAVTVTAPPGDGEGTIRGVVWHDREGAGVRSGGEPGIPGVAVFLDENGDGRLDPGEVFTVTDSDGEYSFEGVDTGRSHTVTQRLELGWTNTFPENAPAAAPARIIGGSEAGEGQFPFMVALHVAGGQFFCGGTFIASRWVMTAAHCVDEGSPVGRNAENLEVLVGTRDRTQGGERVGVSSIQIFPAYAAESFAGNDVALLELEGTFMIPRIQLQTREHPAASLPGTLATVAGWGRPSRNVPPVEILRTVEMEIISNPECQRMLDETVVASTICAGTLGGLESVCSGDSGGPLMVQEGPLWVQVGITSFGAFTCQPPMAFARVSELLDWVQRQVPREASAAVVVNWSEGSTAEVDFGNFK